MTTQNNVTPQIHSASVGKRILQGAGIALILITIFLLGAGEPKPEWHRLWMVKPLVIVPAAGAMGGIFYYYMDHLRDKGVWMKALAMILSLIGYLFALWIGFVLGLNGTMWD